MDQMNALITGASRGIGRAIATALAAQGYNLILVCHRNSDMLNELAVSLTKEYGIDCTCHIGDVGDEAFVKKVFAPISSIDVLINNAGMSYFGLIQDMSSEEWRQIMATNLDSVFYFSREAAHRMIAKHDGRIINISSVWGEQGASLEAAYSASKGAINALTKSMGKELAPSGIAVNAIACGLIDTDMNAHLSKYELDELIAEIPADRMGTPEDVAKMVVSLISAPSYLTGQVITLDGGWI